MTPEDKADLTALCDGYLSGLHTTLWGEVHEVVSPRGRAEAATWLAGLLDDLDRFITEAGVPEGLQLGQPLLCEECRDPVGGVG